jgi:hypothetical protein
MAWLNAPLATDPQLIVIPDAAQAIRNAASFAFFPMKSLGSGFRRNDGWRQPTALRIAAITFA